jgi:hypothetical protein
MAEPAAPAAMILLAPWFGLAIAERLWRWRAPTPWGARSGLPIHPPRRRQRRRKALPTTDTDDRLIANAASIGLSCQPNSG